MWRLWTCALASVVAGVSFGCSSSGPDVVAGAGGEVPVERALAESPLQPAGGVPLTGDDDHLWISDFRQVGRYSLSGESWEMFDLPWTLENNSGMMIVPVAGELWGAALVCPEPCDRARPDGSPPVRLQAFRLDDEGLSVVGEPTEVLEEWGDFYLVGVDQESMSISVRQGSSGGVLFTIDGDGVHTDQFEPNLSALCAVESGYVGVETVHIDAAGAVPWAPLPKEWEPDPDDAKRFVAGSTVNNLELVQLPDAAVPVLADWVGQATMCIPGGIALIGEEVAWEYIDGTWNRQESTLGEGVLAEHAGVGQVLGDGVLYGPIPSGALRRDVDGSWSLLPADPVYVRLGEDTLTYDRPEVPPIDTESEEGPGHGS